MSNTQPYDWADDLASGFAPPEPLKISEEKNPYRRGSLVGTWFDPPIAQYPKLEAEMAETIQRSMKVILDQQARRVEGACRSALANGFGVLIIESGGVVLYAAACPLVPPMQQYVWKHTGDTEDLQNLVSSVYDVLRAQENGADDEDGAGASAPDERM